MAKPTRPLTTSLSPVAESRRWSCSISNRCNALAKEELTDWNFIVFTINQAVNDSIGCTRCTPRHLWISPSTREIIELAEARFLGVTESHTQYRDKRRQRKILAKRSRTPGAAENNNFTQVYRTLWLVKTGTHQRMAQVKDTQGNILNSEDACINQWKEHFSDLLHHPPPQRDPTLTVPSNASANPNCSIDPVTKEEVLQALSKL